MSDMQIQKPTLGRVVIFAAFRGHGEGNVDEYAGIVVGLTEKPGVVDLKTFGPASIYCNLGVPYDADGKAGTWRYPPKSDETIEVGGAQ